MSDFSAERFGKFVLDVAGRPLIRSEKAVDLRPRPFATFRYRCSDGDIW